MENQRRRLGAGDLAMAESLTLEQGQADDAARQREFRRINEAQKREIKQHQAKVATRAAAGLSQAKAPLAAAEQAANLAWRRIWSWGQEIVEEASIVPTVVMVFSGPVAVVLYLARLIGGNGFSGGPKIGFRGFKVSLFPPYDFVEGTYRTGKIIYIGLITATIYGIITLAGYYLVNPQEFLGLIGDVIFGVFKSIFGGGGDAGE